MTDYINREDAIKAFDPKQRQDWYTPWIVETLKDLPPADVAPVRHGRWKKNDYLFIDTLYRCSVCGEEFYLENGTPQENQYYYCPNCGARMDAKE